MPKQTPFVLLLLSLFGIVCAKEITLTQRGVRFQHGALDFTLDYPVLSEKPVVKPTVKLADGQAVLTYTNDRVVTCTINDGCDVEFKSTGLATDTVFRMEATLPLDWAGKTTWNAYRVRKVNQGEKSGTFSVEPFKSSNGRWALYDGIGNGIAIQQGADIIQIDAFRHWTVKDDRQWNWKRFALLSNLVLSDEKTATFHVLFPANLPLEKQPKPAAKPADAPAAKPVLAFGPKGIDVNFGAFVSTMSYPVYDYGKSWDKQIHPKEVRIAQDGKSAELDYGFGRIITCRMNGNAFTYHVCKELQNINKYGLPFMEMYINEIFTENGGQWEFLNAPKSALGKAKSVFPREKADKWYSFSGGASACKITTANGKGDTMTYTARGRYYMKDCRLWGKFWFALCSSPDIRNDEYTVSFDFSKGDAAKVIDRFGQFVNFDFPEKVRSEQDLRDDVAKDEAYYASLEKPNWTFWGGLPGSKEKYGLKATGFFHLERVPALKNRVVLVEPEGNLYFHNGMSGIIIGNDVTCVAGREDIYEELPPFTGSPYSDAWYFRPPRGKAISFYKWNYIRKYGSFEIGDWQKKMIERCRHWGFNAFGEFTFIYGDNANSGFAITRCIEHYANRQPFHLICKDFIDPYDPYNPPLLEQDFDKQTAQWKGKPILIGYYTENERSYNIVMPALLLKKADSFAKQRFVAFMKERYKGNFASFNAAWKTSATSFETLADTPIYAEKIASNPQAATDLGAFEYVFFDDYFALLSKTLKKVDPDHLYLGERMLIAQTFNDAVVKAMGKHCDVFSVNHYTNEYDPADIERFGKISGLPVMLSEWSFGSHDQGLYGARNKANDEERGKAYSRYVENAAASSCVIGQQWFIFLDESNTGRGFTVTNGERFNMGFLNVCDRPFKKFAAHAAESNKKVYAILTGEAKPVPLAVESTSHAESLIMPVGRVKPGLPIDALRTKYPGRPGEGIHRSVAGNAPKKSDRADMICGWDDTYLYVLVTVQDDTPACNTHKQGIWMGDSVEIFYGPYAQNVSKMRPYDRQIGIRANTLPDPDFRWDCAGAQLMDSPRPKTFVRIAPDKKSWAMEVALPWKEINVVPKTGMKLNFDLAINLNGKAINVQSNKLVWNGLESNYYRRDLWGTIVLED